MAVNKEHKEFHQVDLSRGWETPPGYPAGIQQKILAGSLDEPAKARPIRPTPMPAVRPALITPVRVEERLHAI